MLEFDFAKRLSVDEALAHPYFADIRDHAWEMEATPEQLRWGDIDTAETTRLQMQRIIMEDGARLNAANAEVLAELQRRCEEVALAAKQEKQEGGRGRVASSVTVGSTPGSSVMPVA